MFAHLHTHSEYSLLDGACRVRDMARRAKELGQTAIALTDHGVMYGSVEFYNACKNEGVKPIIGCEIYTAAKSRHDRTGNVELDRAHLVLLAKNAVGYKNLIHIVSLGFTEGFYYRPRVDMEVLRAHGEGIIALSACLAGEIPQRLLGGDFAGAKQKALEYRAVFDDFYLELQDHGIEEQKKLNPLIVKLSEETGIELVATNDAHYLLREDAKVQDILLCIQTGKTLDEENRMRFETEEFYLKSEDEMRALFSYAPKAVDNTQKIADLCDFDFDFQSRHLPEFALPEGEKDACSYLEALCEAGLKARYGETMPEEAPKRLRYELDVIKTMGFVDYFLVVWDFVRFAKENGIMVGPGRGSGAGSIVAYTLRITDIDPLKYNLLFERFLNPERVSMPDIDIDFCYERRGEVINYVTGKYGADHVAQIITFNTMKARGAIRDTGRVLGIPLSNVDAIAKMVPMALGMTLKDALKTPLLKEAYEAGGDAKTLVDAALKLENIPRNAGTHAAGVVISKEPIYEHVPLQCNGDTVTTQFPMETIEKLGLLKMDFLGLRNLTIIRDALLNIEQSGGKLDLDAIRYDCPEVYDMLSKGETDGVFQLESGGMRSFMRNLSPGCLEDIIAGIALYRPGPMDFIPQYIANKRNPSGIKYKHPLLRDILDVTYGCIVYQEQVMQIVRALAGFSMGKADEVRRAMSKKKADVMARARQSFIHGEKDAKGNVAAPGCAALGISEKVASSIFDDMDAFARYAFNKAHATAYAVIAYQTAYLKCFYPSEYMAALLTAAMNENTKVAAYIEQCRRMGIEILPPDINKSRESFTVEGGKIRFGLGCVKNVGRDFVRNCAAERTEKGDFQSLTDFARRMTGRDINKRAVEGLIRCGAFDTLEGSRAQKLAYYETALDSASRENKMNLAGQMSLFGESENLRDEFPKARELSVREMLAMEKEAAGIYLSGHPLEERRKAIEAFSTVTCNDLQELSGEEEGAIADKTAVKMAGIITGVRTKLTKSNNIMAYVTLEDLTGSVELIVFPRDWKRFDSVLREDSIVGIAGRTDFLEDRDTKVVLESAAPLPAEVQNGKTLVITLGDGQEKLLDAVRPAFLRHRGGVSVKIGEIAVQKQLCVDASAEFVSEIEAILGAGSVQIVG